MSQEQKFFICKHCGNLVGMIHNAGVKIICCGEPMTELVPNTTDAAGEKHLPVVEVSGKQVTVSVGSVPHPMTEEHHIAWVYLQTAKGGQQNRRRGPYCAGEEINHCAPSLVKRFNQRKKAYCEKINLIDRMNVLIYD